ncbi:hypothetical protein F5B22DRAFT_601556 [Xylaria bambusicola]|uniref:uncharacterized protein n=1 Tax=Xylaria bambusicola TaxID=326684 RepID=UPI0020072197|nr:uncharacterized protein F5B22DRAFT_601556 [Xylaria bambusicola]KAI0518063.1 hypothetical protein F5B22DRAFT_601556 [Xylaria bambusicola]
MAYATSLQFRTLLTLPTALRPLLLSTISPSGLQYIQSRMFCASPLQYRRAKYPNVAAFTIPEFRTSSISGVTRDKLFKTSSLLSAPGQPLEEELTKLYADNPATFIYAESDFYTLKKNTRVPEVCILGRSNVGKSSFVNALAMRRSDALARVSSKAGKTRSMNMYGFGPAPTVKELQAQGSKYKDEDIPTHTFHVVDMPGYGHASQEEWGKNIALYMSKRQAVKGAIVLIDAEVGPKDSDFHLLQLLSAAQLKTAIVLTKADKVKTGWLGLHQTCTKIVKGILAIEAQITEGTWTWEREIYVTAVGARDAAVAHSTVTTARLAVARLAGLVKDERPNVERNTRWSGKMVSFDDLQLAPSTAHGSPKDDHYTNISNQPTQDTPSRLNARSEPPLSRNSFADLEHAATAHGNGRARNYARSRPQSLRKGNRAHARTFHTKVAQRGKPAPKQLIRAELDVVLGDFIKTLKTDTPRDQVRRLQQERERRPPKLFRISFKKRQKRLALHLQRQFPEQTTRTRAVLVQRLGIEERRRQAMNIRQAESQMLVESEWPVGEDVGSSMDANHFMGVNEFDEAFAASKGFPSDKSKKGIAK